MGYNSEKLYIYHFTHIDNLPSIIEHGLFADAHIDCDGYKNVGNLDIKDRRKHMVVPFGGCVANYVPFYFAPKSPMMYTQWRNGKIENEKIIYIVVNAHVLIGKYAWCCSDMNAAKDLANFYNTVKDLEEKLPWDIFDADVWKNDDAHPDRMERRMAEFLSYEHVAWDDILGIAAYNETASKIVAEMQKGASRKPIAIIRKWYY